MKCKASNMHTQSKMQLDKKATTDAGATNLSSWTLDLRGTAAGCQTKPCKEVGEITFNPFIMHGIDYDYKQVILTHSNSPILLHYE